MERPSYKDEMKKALKNTKNGKAPCLVNIPPELLKESIDLTANILCNLFEQIWKREKIPKVWRKSLLFKLPKKGNVLNCSNWRGITLLSVSSKILSCVIHGRIKNGIEIKLRREQAGFRSNTSCVDQSNTVTILIEQPNEFLSALYLLFIDFEKAFDSIDRD
jgi:sorting nexin-29